MVQGLPLVTPLKVLIYIYIYNILYYILVDRETTESRGGDHLQRYTLQAGD